MTHNTRPCVRTRVRNVDREWPGPAPVAPQPGDSAPGAEAPGLHSGWRSRLQPRRAAAAVLALIVLSGAAGTLAGCRSSDDHGAAGEAAVTKYHCPMHPMVVSDKPGECPICGMDLVLIEPATAKPAASPPSGGRKIAYYRSPMDPSIHSDKPSKDSMGMEFVPVFEDEVSSSPNPVAGRATVVLSTERRALLGVRSEEVRETRIDRTIRTVGRVAADERRLAHVHTKFEGYVERLYVDFTGKLVQKGDPLLALYSPELIATQQEYLLALRAQKQLGGSQIPSVAQGGANLAEAARERLRLWDISAADIAELERTGTVRRAFDLHAEVSGFVTVKNVVQGMRVMPADTVFEIADLSQVWVLADVYESDLRSIRLGMSATMTLSYQAGREWRGRVSYVAPTVDPATRTVEVRVEVANQGGALKPGMFGDVVLRVEEGTGLVVPDSAVIDTGDRRLVFLDRQDGTIEPRQVEVGAKLADGYQVLRGLARGDRVVTSANFLLDSESSLKAALAALASPAQAPVPEKR
jgi:membrane fusion protein, copper/silver efflux system